MSSGPSLRRMYAENTRRVLVDTGLRAFVEQGFAAVSAEELVRAAGLSRGALYHHFGGKRGLFEAVFEDQQRHARDRVEARVRADHDLLEQLLAGMDTFLDICGERDYREIVLVQGPVALGWQRWRELDRQQFHGLLLASATRMIDAGLLPGDIRPDLHAAGLYGMLTEMSFTIADADDPVRARQEAGRCLRRAVSAG
ncbi:TetR/AcrR family transcriptional regulator [Nocardia bovistercoris]|uniref:TetR/AcrR family transcriptional regulator n=1 Tax=Nocardia bovistercoris TaxID=2785916 RepID=A0A931IDK3_9NOCA|nr:TetR/AcrR family transcriptional regulator [Nocardia bovistercoris]MBH0779459.1 TetR/AcrR family transcriptional regulator [Nocardia bovistercoris]